MTTETLIQVLHGVGFLTAVALYAMLLSMAWRPLPGAIRRWGDTPAALTAVLGLAWNLGALALVSNVRFAEGVMSLAYAALGLLPAVFVHAAVGSWSSGPARPRAGRWLCWSAYALSGSAAVLQVAESIASGGSPSRGAFRMLAIGFITLVPLMVVAAPPSARRSGGPVWALALVVFALSAWHLGQHEAAHEAWPAVVLGHHASIPMALAILWLDYRFALADIFLKRALALLVLVGGIVIAYLGLAREHVARLEGSTHPAAVTLMLALWAGTALAYPMIRRGTGWFVDTIVLRRSDTSEVLAEIARRLLGCETADQIMEVAGLCLAPALSAGRFRGEAFDGAAPQRSLVTSGRGPGEDGVSVVIPTAEPPLFVLRFEALEGGRRILSDDIALLESAALLVARRLDAMRWLHERCARDLREEEIAKLASQAELRALEAQLNPHFLFNALNTIGYLMKATPERARSTLQDLTRLLRAVLKRSGGGFVTLGEEIELVEAYLSIERARFEERLRLRLEVPPGLRALPVPGLVVQPLVENAIKHGISPRREGGEISVAVWLEEPAGKNPPRPALIIEVLDTGVGTTEASVAGGRVRGVGLANVEKRLRAHYGDAASLTLRSEIGRGTRVTLRLPAGDPARLAPQPLAVVAGGRA
jgi:signal transduction histidine kinase